MSDEQTREKERASLNGDLEAGVALARAQEREGTLEEIGEVSHTLKAPYCCECGNVAAAMETTCFRSLEQHDAYARKASRRETVDGEQPARFYPSYSVSDNARSQFDAMEEKLRQRRPDVAQAVRVRCGEGHEWETYLIAVELVPLPKLEEVECSS